MTKAEAFSLGGKRSLTIVLDRTMSMSESIESMIAFLPMYIIRRYAMDIDQMSLVTFDDHYPDNSYAKPLMGNTIDVYGPTENLEEYIYWLKLVKIGHGEDWAEAIACALATARKLDSDASIWLVTDAAPHGWSASLLNYVSPAWDGFPDGCPCGTVLDLTGVNLLLLPDQSGAYSEDLKTYWGKTLGDKVVLAGSLREYLQEPVRELVEA